MDNILTLKLFNAVVSMCEQYLAYERKGVTRWCNSSMQAGEEAMEVLNKLGCLTKYNGAIGTPDWDKIEEVRRKLKKMEAGVNDEQ